MLVTGLEEVTKNRYKVFIDEQFAFVLYKGELSRFHIKVDSEVTSEEYQIIKSEVILKRAKKRILYLLEQMPRTEQQLRDKMKQNYYTSDMIDEAVSYAKKYGYINDANYVSMYIQDKLNVKSRKELYCLLLQKGIDKETIERELDVVYEGDGESDAIRNLIRKKRYNYEEATEKETQKIYAYLMRKGFSYSDISSVLKME